MILGHCIVKKNRFSAFKINGQFSSASEQVVTAANEFALLTGSLYSLEKTDIDLTLLSE